MVTNSSPRITVLSDGKVGIGTTTPDDALDVQGVFHATVMPQYPANSMSHL